MGVFLWRHLDIRRLGYEGVKVKGKRVKVESFWDFVNINWLNSEIVEGDFPLLKVVLVIVVITLAQVFRKLFSTIIIKYVEDLTSQTETELDDKLIAILKQPLNWLIVIAGVGVAKLIIVTELNSAINKTANNIIGLAAIATVAWIIFRASPLLGELLGNLALETETELDDLVVPYLPKLFQTLAIVIVLLKAAEVLLGASAGALVGLIGGTGITLGLLLKDIVYDWFCTVIIFSDRLYRPGDILKVQGIDKLVQVKNIGVRSTTLCVLSQNALSKIPNSKMITGIVENWSQNPESENLLGIDITLKIDDIPSEQTDRICNTLRRFPKEIEDLSDRFTVWFSGMEQNARIIKVQAFAQVDNLKSYRAIWSEINLGILKVMEQEGIELFSSMPIAILPTKSQNSTEIESSLKKLML
ncbi:mechanosensitive ion channel family protein [Pleurocapsa sp. FMAR1]|uniref:mechanosensitive ion channel family protein n=1 Tax=Pleurocapsa sp. FMAR1 TaxID=3040204 RepID=UPI0029C881BD|nr:mechanosensitive ion channel domain-containing protein [Pleurocapsa sp. FMAR1]